MQPVSVAADNFHADLTHVANLIFPERQLRMRKILAMTAADTRDPRIPHPPCTKVAALRSRCVASRVSTLVEATDGTRRVKWKWQIASRRLTTGSVVHAANTYLSTVDDPFLVPQSLRSG